jgi:hypothetical protein
MVDAGGWRFRRVAIRRRAARRGHVRLDEAAAGRHAAQMNLLLLRNAQVYAPEPLGLQHLLLGGGRILWMGAQLADLPADLSVETIDLHGRRLIPGFIDAHVHVTGGGGEAGFRTRVPRDSPGPASPRWSACSVRMMWRAGRVTCWRRCTRCAKRA